MGKCNRVTCRACGTQSWAAIILAAEASKKDPAQERQQQTAGESASCAHLPSPPAHVSAQRALPTHTATPGKPRKGARRNRTLNTPCTPEPPQHTRGRGECYGGQDGMACYHPQWCAITTGVLSPTMVCYHHGCAITTGVLSPRVCYHQHGVLSPTWCAITTSNSERSTLECYP